MHSLRACSIAEWNWWHAALCCTGPPPQWYGTVRPGGKADVSSVSIAYRAQHHETGTIAVNLQAEYQNGELYPPGTAL